MAACHLKVIGVALLIVVALSGCAGGARTDQTFVGTERSAYAKDRYDCMLKHENVGTFIACMEGKGYQHTGEK